MSCPCSASDKENAARERGSSGTSRMASGSGSGRQEYVRFLAGFRLISFRFAERKKAYLWTQMPKQDGLPSDTGFSLSLAACVSGRRRQRLQSGARPHRRAGRGFGRSAPPLPQRACGRDQRQGLRVASDRLGAVGSRIPDRSVHVAPSERFPRAHACRRGDDLRAGGRRVRRAEPGDDRARAAVVFRNHDGWRSTISRAGKSTWPSSRSAWAAGSTRRT